MSESGCDALFFGAHPDDVEILAGGLVAKLTRAGRRVVIADATRGEMGTRGTPEERAIEAANAARI
ncbi:PIG-L family deacetylase, partial [Candidatus Poribacteria bacterium]|nr:PIG-L family deacetylase [Candidatus Poribacteria bacterium]